MKKTLCCIVAAVSLFADSVNGWRPLHEAVYEADMNRTRSIVEGGSCDIDAASKAGISPLHIAVKTRNLPMVEYLLAHGADVDAQDNNGYTPLAYAIGQHRLEIVRSLIRHHADINLANDAGITPLQQAAYGNDFDIVDLLLENGIEPYVTLYHWDMPQEVFIRGGWLNPESARWFEDYARIAAKRFGDRVRNWITINEPQCAIILGLEDGTHAPGLQLPRAQVLQAGHHLLLAHGLAVGALREHAALKPSIGIAPVGTVYYPVDETPENIAAARAATFGNWEDKESWIASWFSDPVYLGHYPESAREWLGNDFPVVSEEEMRIISQPLDMCAINFYQGYPIQAANTPSGWETLKHPDGHPHTSFGWPVTPSAFYWLVKFYHERYQLPILITENGLSNTDWADCDGVVMDAPRIDFLRRYLGQLKRAANDGIPINGYFHWSLMDNFVWAEGYHPRFGLTHVDYQTQKRTLKQSAHFYKEIIDSNGAVL